MAQSPEHLAEVAEATAPADIAAIYARIRHLTGAPMTALVWRHLATYPGALQEIWRAIGPFYEAGILQEAAWRTARDSVTIPPANPTSAALSALGLSATEQAAYRRVLDAYNRANPVNFVAVRSLMHRMNSAQASPTQSLSPWSPPSPVTDVPPMVAIAAIPPDIRHMIDELASDPRLDRRQLVPSLYRHLVESKPLIPAIHETLLPRFHSGEIPRQVKATAAAMDAEARRIAERLPPIATLAKIPGVVETFERFSMVIPEMVVLGVLLRRGIET